LYNRIVARFIFSALDARGLSESKFAKQAGVARSVLSTHLSGARKIRPNHLAKYMTVLDHEEQPKLLAGWLRDNFPEDVSVHLLNDARDNLRPEVREYVPPMDDEHRRMLAWLAREMARDAELAELFTLLSARAGYRPRRTAAGPPKRRRKRRRD
jgi:hypothetical protein